MWVGMAWSSLLTIPVITTVAGKRNALHWRHQTGELKADYVQTLLKYSEKFSILVEVFFSSEQSQSMPCLEEFSIVENGLVWTKQFPHCLCKYELALTTTCIVWFFFLFYTSVLTVPWWLTFIFRVLNLLAELQCCYRVQTFKISCFSWI